jgi:hypothetical protein
MDMEQLFGTEATFSKDNQTTKLDHYRRKPATAVFLPNLAPPRLLKPLFWKLGVDDPATRGEDSLSNRTKVEVTDKYQLGITGLVLECRGERGEWYRRRPQWSALCGLFVAVTCG